MIFKGQEKVKILYGEFKECIGYVRGVRTNHHLLVILDNGYKISIHQNEVECIHSNYFIEQWENRK